MFSSRTLDLTCVMALTFREIMDGVDSNTDYHIYPTIRQGFSVSRMTSNNQIILIIFFCNRVLSFLTNPKDQDPFNKIIQTELQITF